MAARNAEIVYKPFYEGKGRHKTFIKGNGRAQRRNFYTRLFIKGNAVIKTFIKGTGRAQRGNVLKS